MFENGYIKNLTKIQPKKEVKKNVWSIDLESVWLPFFTATNAMGDTAIPHEALGAPLRLSYNKDNSVKFAKSGKPIVKVAKDISQMVSSVKSNFIAGLQSYTTQVYENEVDKVKAEITVNLEAGKPIIDNDNANLKIAYQKIEEQLKNEADKNEAESIINEAENITQQRELVPA
jgi:uncharacterized protein (DUF2164 family)